MGGASNSVFPSFNAGSQASGSSTGFNFSTGTSNTGVSGLFQKAGSTPGQTSNPLAAGNSTQKSGINFNFSASAIANQQQQQPQQNQSQGGLFTFGQKSNGPSGFNFSGNGNTSLGNQSQNGNSGFNFSAGMGINPGGGGGGASGGVFNNKNSSSNIFQSQVQQPSPNVFQTPQPQKQPSFTTPTNQPGQGGFNFQSNPSGLNISFSAGTPGGPGSSARPVARARRRKK